MKTMATVAAALALATGLVTTAGAARTSAAGVSEPSRVLIVGDSVTQGRDGDFTWRYFAWRRLAAAGGRERRLRRNRTGTHVDGVPGLGRLLRGPRVRPGPTQPAGAVDDGDAAQLLRRGSHHRQPRRCSRPRRHRQTLGINDMSYAYGDVEDFAEQVRLFVAEARTAKADVDVVRGARSRGWHVADYNALLAALATDCPSASVAWCTPVAWARATSDARHRASRTRRVTESHVVVSAAPPSDVAAGTRRSVPTPPVAAQIPTTPASQSAPSRAARIVVTWRDPPTDTADAARGGRGHPACAIECRTGHRARNGRRWTRRFDAGHAPILRLQTSSKVLTMNCAAWVT